MSSFLKFYLIERRKKLPSATKPKKTTTRKAKVDATQVKASLRDQRALIRRLKDIRDYSDDPLAAAAAEEALQAAPLRGDVAAWKAWAKEYADAINVRPDFFSQKTVPIEKKPTLKSKFARMSQAMRERLFKNPDLDRKNPQKIFVPRLRIVDTPKIIANTAHLGSHDTDSFTISFYRRPNVKSAHVVRAVVDIPQRAVPKLDLKDKAVRSLVSNIIKTLLIYKRRNNVDVFLFDNWATTSPVHKQLHQWAKDELTGAGWSSANIGNFWAVSDKKAALTKLKRELKEGVDLMMPIVTEKWINRALLGVAALSAAGLAALPSDKAPPKEKPSYTEIKKKNDEGAYRYAKDLHLKQIKKNLDRLKNLRQQAALNK